MSEFKKYFNEKFFKYGCFEEKGKNIDNLLSNEMSVICGDFYGIQKFIFEGLTTKHAAKVLRAKSAFVELFTKIVAKFICKELGHDEDRILSCSAGKFEILVNSRISSERIDKIQGILDEYFIKNFYAISGMSVVCVDCSSNDFKSPSEYKALRKKIADKIEAKKFNKFSLLRLENPVLGGTKDITNQTLCEICNMRKSVTNKKCGICDAFIDLGKKLTSGDKNINSKIDLHIDFCDIDVELDEKIKSYVKKEGDNIVDFEKLASNKLGALSVLKADVDGMGNFIKESEVTNSFSSFDCFSKNIDAFFSLYVSKIIKEKFPDTYVVFAGGDDLFIIGEWQKTMELARYIRSEFMSFVEPLKNTLSISFGAAIAKHSTPVKYLADETERLLEMSKEFKDKNDKAKNAISMFNMSVSWDNYTKCYEALREKLQENILKADDVTAFFYRILELCDMRIALLEGSREKVNPKNAMWRSKLYYSIERNAQKDSKDELLKLLENQIENHPKETKMIISQIIYIRRGK